MVILKIIENRAMKRGISFQGTVPMRQQPSDEVEMNSQLLFGEEFTILDSKAHWLLISLDFDGFEGWVMSGSVKVVESGNSKKKEHLRDIRIVSCPMITVRDLKLGQQCVLPAGSIWPVADGQTLQLHTSDFQLSSEEGLITPGSGVKLDEVAKGLVSLPYVKAGRSGFGFDAPGLVQTLCRMTGILVPRSTVQQSDLGSSINFMHEIRNGDLAFFDNQEGKLIMWAFCWKEDKSFMHITRYAWTGLINRASIQLREKSILTN